MIVSRGGGSRRVKRRGIEEGAEVVVVGVSIVVDVVNIDGKVFDVKRDLFGRWAWRLHEGVL